ncbi:MAG TPA: FtsX-like permease family protein, partial [Saprospiraceae bacterium]|nr:FtsX-like permease family protein [Saprospiraceae bacterium]
FSFIPITELHLSGLANREGFSGSTKYLYFFGTIALFILLIASVNYVNLATARVSTRFKEIGIRKTLGAQRSQIALQFLGESIFLCLVAFVLSVSLAEFLLPFFNDLFGTNLVWEKNSAFLLFSAIGAVLVGVLAGLYPSFYLSKFSPSDVLKSIHTSGSSGTLLRKSLVVSQFAIALILIIGSLVIFKQLEYAQSKDLGFEGEQVMVIELPNKIATQKKNTIVNNLRNRSGVISATISDAIPGSFGASFIMSPDDLSPDHNVPGNTKEIEYSIHLYPAIVDYHYFETLNMSLIAGRNFSEDYPSDFENGYIINEKAAEALGWKPVEAVGKTFGIKKEGTVIGVVSNFHLKSLHEDIPPVSFQLHAGTNWSNTEKIAVKVTPDNIPNVINDLKEVFAEYTPYQTLNYEFLDDKFDAMYRTEKRLGQISGLFTVIAIFIACLGLFGLAAYSAERRTKEIGIRKALGASITNILALLSKDFVKLVILGFMFAIPISWYAMNQWLADFAYRIEIGPGIFALAGGTALVIALLTVSWQSIKAALANPVESLRSE